jgi:hypothetical protein
VSAAALAVLAACRHLVGIGDSPPTSIVDASSESSAPACGVAYAGEACEACLESSCCDVAQECSGVAECAAMESCLGGCSGDPACRATCLVDHHLLSSQAVVPLDSCMVASCSSQCGLVCGGAGEVATPDTAAGCQNCFLGQDCSRTQRCLGSLDCASYAWCLATAATPDVFNACPALLDGGDPDSSAFASVARTTCAEFCAFDANWSCVGRVELPPAATTTLTIHLTLTDGGTQQLSGPGILAKVCGATDETCVSPVATGITGPDGTVDLVQTVDAGAVLVTEGYIELSGGSGGGILPEVFFWSYPLVGPVANLFATTITPTGADDIYRGVGLTRDPALAGVFVVGYDCRQITASGLTYTLSTPGDFPAYYADGAVFASGLLSTDSSGGAVFLDVPPGNATVTATIAGSTTSIGHSSFFFRAGALTEVWALPK